MEAHLFLFGVLVDLVVEIEHIGAQPELLNEHGLLLSGGRVEKVGQLLYDRNRYLPIPVKRESGKKMRG